MDIYNIFAHIEYFTNILLLETGKPSKITIELPKSSFYKLRHDFFKEYQNEFLQHEDGGVSFYALGVLFKCLD